MERIYKVVEEDILPILNIDSSHGVDHFKSVENHAVESSRHLEGWMIDVVRIAAYCHDLDDHKLVKNSEVVLSHKTGLQSRYPNLTHVLNKCEISNKNMILTIVDLVSCSKNGDSYDPRYPTWYYIPRYCDRAEAIGKIGIDRITTFRPDVAWFDDTTERATSFEEIEKVATKERYDEYTTGMRVSTTKMGNIYDKLLHIKIPEWFDNEYLEKLFAERQNYIKEWVVEYWSKRI